MSVQTPPQFVSGVQSSAVVDVVEVVGVSVVDDDVELLVDDVLVELVVAMVVGAALVEVELDVGVAVEVVVGSTPPQAPALHATPTGHALPQVPQLAASF